jgi:hypothetical protein
VLAGPFWPCHFFEPLQLGVDEPELNSLKIKANYRKPCTLIDNVNLSLIPKTKNPESLNDSGF